MKRVSIITKLFKLSFYKILSCYNLGMKNIEVKCPAKINLTLEVVNRREDGFHNIKSIMQMISLYDTLNIKVSESDENKILLSGNSDEIPYNEKNLVYKATKLFLDKTKINHFKIEIFIDKKIPVAAGLAGGSTDAAGTLVGLNKIFNEPLNRQELHELCASLGSDLNVCLEGGCVLATSRGEVIEKLPYNLELPVTLIKPKKLGISAKEAYTKYALKKNKPQNNMTEKMLEALKNNESINDYLYNDLEYAIFDDYTELQNIKSKLPHSIMSGSGSTYFVLENLKDNPFGEDYQVISGIKFIGNGI